MYYDTSASAWSTEGLYNISYDYDTGLLNCSTSHLSEFSMDYISLTKVTIDTNSSDNTTTTSYFFDNYTLYYYLGVGIPAFITLVTIFISSLDFSIWDAKNPRLEKLRK